MDVEGPEGDEPDYHPEELQGQQGEMELFIVPPNPPRTRAKRARSRAKQKATKKSQPASKSEQAPCSAEVEQPLPTASSSSSRFKSKVWKDFTRISKEDDDLIIAECNHCKKQLSGKSSNGTSHLLRHIEAMHKTDNATMNNYFLKAETNDDGTTAFKNGKFDVQAARMAISIYLVSGSHPFTTVEEDGFRHMMTSCCPQFKVVSRRILKREIMAMYLSQRKETMEAILGAPGRVSFTSDNWKSEVSKDSYIFITCHYIDADWKLNKRIVWFKKLDPPYDGSSIADEVHLAFREWRFEQKVMCITLDNASYNDRMIKCLRTRLSKGALPLSGKFFQIRCCGHILNLVVQAGLTLIDPAAGKLRDGIMYLKASGTRLHKFYSTAKTIFNLEESRRLKPDMPIRWNSTYKMLGCCLYYKEVMQWYSKRDSIFEEHFWPSEEEWAKISHMYQFLEVFFKVTTVFSGTKYPTANLYFMNVYLVHTAIMEASAGINNYMADMLHVMREKFMKYWSNYSVFLSCAAVLDPRIKFKFLMYSYSKLYDEVDAHRRITDVRNTLTSLFNEYGSGSGVVSNENVATSGFSSTCGLSAFDDYDQYVATTSSQEEKSELDLYLAEPVKRLNENVDILDYWSKSAARYPQLSRMARDILVIPVSSVASESALSLSKKVITPNRSSLKPKTVEALMCLRDWYRCKMQKKEIMKKRGC
uniref:Uncharacterized protein n=1 Tax=Avena sativa TaxID=4498 RepID=A0ACD5WR84_AVESA